VNKKVIFFIKNVFFSIQIWIMEHMERHGAAHKRRKRMTVLLNDTTEIEILKPNQKNKFPGFGVVVRKVGSEFVRVIRSGLQTWEQAHSCMLKIEEDFEKNQINHDIELKDIETPINRFGHITVHDRVLERGADDVFHHSASKRSTSWNSNLKDCGQAITMKVNKRPDHPEKNTITLKSTEWGTSEKGRQVEKETLMWLDETTARNLQKFLNEALG
jgi:hypothetical protein